MKIQDEVIKIRQELGMTAREISDLIDISETTFWNWEKDGQFLPLIKWTG